jgi:predicted  nucleic acid-binding Zn-ribbon protein
MLTRKEKLERLMDLVRQLDEIRMQMRDIIESDEAEEDGIDINRLIEELKKLKREVEDNHYQVDNAKEAIEHAEGNISDAESAVREIGDEIDTISESIAGFISEFEGYQK